MDDRHESRTTDLPTNLWNERSLVDVILFACEGSDDQAEIERRVDEMLGTSTQERAVRAA